MEGNFSRSETSGRGHLWEDMILPPAFFFFALTGLSWHIGSFLHPAGSLLYHMDSLVAAHRLGARGFVALQHVGS